MILLLMSSLDDMLNELKNKEKKETFDSVQARLLKHGKDPEEKGPSLSAVLETLKQAAHQYYQKCAYCLTEYRRASKQRNRGGISPLSEDVSLLLGALQKLHQGNVNLHGEERQLFSTDRMSTILERTQEYLLEFEHVSNVTFEDYGKVLDGIEWARQNCISVCNAWKRYTTAVRKSDPQ